MVKRNNKLNFVITYIVIVVLLVGINLLLYIPVNSKINSAK